MLSYIIHKVTTKSFAFTVYGQSCRLYVLEQQGISNISVSCSCCSIYSLFFNRIILICYYTCSLIYLEHLFCFKYQTQLALQHGSMYLVTTDTEFSNITAPYP